MGVIGWLVALGSIFIGAAIGVWGFTEFNRMVAIWLIGVPGAIFIVVAGGFELQGIALAAKSAKANEASHLASIAPIQIPHLVARISGPYVDESRTPLNMIKEGEKLRWIVIRVSVEIENLSETPATITGSSMRAMEVDGPSAETNLYELLNKGDIYYPGRYQQKLPDTPAYNDLRYVDVGGFNLTAETREMIFSNPPPIVGKIIYRGPSGKSRELGYAFKPLTAWHPSGFKRWGGDEYNYDREID